MPYYNRKEYPKQIWVSQIPEREVSLLRENLAGIKQTTFVLIKKEEAFHKLSEKRSRDIIFLSSNQSLLDLARDMDVPAIACQKPETDTFLHADMVVEGFEEVDMTFLQRVYERYFNIPWTILETERWVYDYIERQFGCYMNMRKSWNIRKPISKICIVFTDMECGSFLRKKRAH